MTSRMKWFVALAAIGALAAAGYAGVKRKPAATAQSAQAVVTHLRDLAS